MHALKSLVAVVALAAASASASGQSAFFSGNTTGAPTFNRPADLVTLSLVGTAVRYVVQPFTVSATGNYTMEVRSTSGAYDPYLLLYSTSFNAATPLLNLMNGDDDYSGAFSVLAGNGTGTDACRIASGDATNFTSAPAGSLLTAGVQYYLVVTGFGNGDVGPFNAGIGGGPGSVTIPAPGALAMIGVAGLISHRRRRGT